ncbi:MlaD family protein [Nocardia sp. NBC_01388]|uniref:MlaD family protein n=1 Tax=Nocardia sp. NBC_01388 TaxID=2903596 RepID=UPI003254E491
MMRRRKLMGRSVIALALTLSTLCAAGACGFDPAAVPVPGATVSGAKMNLHIQFANALNLPPGAKVIANGVEVGNLTGVRIADPRGGSPGFVVADLAIRDDLRLPVDTAAELRQATPLGDVYISLTAKPGSAGPFLKSGDTVPRSQTTPATQVEDTMSGLAAAVNGGTISSFQDIVRQLNQVLPADPQETARMFGVLGQDLTDVSSNLTSVDSVIDGLQANTDMVLQDREKLQALLTEAGVQRVTAVINSVVQVIFILTGTGPLAHQALWLAPLVQSLDGTARAVVPVLFAGNPLDVNAPSNLRKLVDLIQNKLIPFGRLGPKVDVTGIQVAGAAPDMPVGVQTDRIVQTLRMIGAVR